MTADSELLTAWRAGDQTAGIELFDRYYPNVSRFFRSKTRDGWADLVQSTFLACAAGKDRFRGETGFRQYLFSIAYKQLISHYRRRSRDHAKIDFSEFSAVDLDPSPSAVTAERQELQLMLRALRHIPLDAQIILELHYWEHMSTHECALTLELPHSTAKWRLRRARELVKQKMQTLAESPELATSTIDGFDRWAAALRDEILTEP
ncbi:RNA polymerase sigma factor [Enhygromyxa salina]|uniref:ECF RNA polymerase sigma-E factor n=1 Tax=Enhygromyxa salina TaxID=215803 RepID=A0A2S9XLW2_9BACT|nr:sigma-70 family RNA polymerase sigma factor [Enhygromyxa salina]PRP93671.1 ECF RNA polymerase sigma-E factor [Enhygromyxa salina]